MRRTLALLVGWTGLASSLAAQAAPVQSATLRRAIQAYENVEFAQVVPLARAALRERLTTADRARAYELLAFTFAATRQPDSAISAFREVLQLDPDREIDPRQVSPRVAGYFNAALGQVMVVRQLRVDTSDRRLRQRFAERAASERRALSLELRRAGADHVVLTTSGDWLRELAGFLRRLGGRR